MAGTLAALLAAPAASAHGRRRRVACADLTALTFEGNTSVTAATEVTSGSIVTPTGITLTDLPAFCRVQGVSRPTSDSNIYYEVWLSSPPARAGTSAP